MESDWLPSLQKSERPLYLALVRAMADDITSGRLPKGHRLPPQRELADLLKIAIGTVTRAYTEAERRGLVYGDGRRGTFVGDLPRRRNVLATLADAVSVGIDLSKNHPAPKFDPDLASELRQLARSPRCSQLLAYPPPSGPRTHREAGATWLRTLGMEPEPDNLFISGGAQHGLLSIIAATTHPGDVIAAEEYTYPGVKAVAQMLGLELVGVPIDDQGIIPDALESICKLKDIRLLYCNPSLQNPTNALMLPRRREQIAALADKYDFFVAEDEILAPLLEELPQFISNIVPDRCFFLISTSKCVAAGLRLGFIVSPPCSRQKLADCMQTTTLGQPPLTAEIFSRWLANGAIARAISQRKEELAWAQHQACEMLKEHPLRSHRASYHIWLELPALWTAANFANEAQMRGVAVAPSEIFAVDPRSSINAVRLSLGGLSDRAHLKAGLRIIVEILSGSSRQAMATV